MNAFLSALGPVIVIVALGRLLAWRGTIAPEGWRAAERLSYVLLFPLLIIRALANAPFETAPWKLAAALLIAQCALALLSLAARGLNFIPRHPTGAIIQSNARWNTFVALSIAASLFGEEGLALVAIAAAAMIPTANVISVAALTHFSERTNGEKPALLKPLATNPLIIACVIGGALNVAGLPPTGMIDRTMEILAQATIALGLLTAGAGVDLGALKRAGLRTFTWSLIRLAGLPLIAIGLALALGVSGMQLAIVAICSATPTATNGYILARQLGGDAPLSANLIAVQTVLAAITMPAAYILAMSLGG
ncbi:MAG: AEC family transporter [Pseudomonadota bacterium]